MRAKSGTGTIGCLGSVMRQTGPRGSIRKGALALRGMLSRHHGRLMTRKRHVCSIVEGKVAIGQVSIGSDSVGGAGRGATCVRCS